MADDLGSKKIALMSEPGTSDFIIVPAGIIFPFAGIVVPSGFLLCDGSSVLRATYVSLFTAIGTSWGAIDSENFNLPDLRGRFLRGVDGGVNRDIDRTSRTANSTGGNIGDAVGSVQGNAIKTTPAVNTGSGNIKSRSPDNVQKDVHFLPSGVPTISSATFATIATVANQRPHHEQNGFYHDTLSQGSYTVGTGGDTRPENANVFYIIKY